MENKIEKWEETLLNKDKIDHIKELHKLQVFATQEELLLRGQAKATWDAAFEAGLHTGRKEVVELIEEQHEIQYPY